MLDTSLNVLHQHYQQPSYENTIHTRYFKFNLFFIGQILFDYFIRKHSNLIHGTSEGKYYNKLFCTSSMSISLISNLTAVLHEIQE